MTTMQKRALAGIVISGALLAATALVLFLNDPATLFANDAAEAIYLGALLVGVGGYGLLILATRKAGRGEAVAFDERDRYIIRRALAAQLHAVIVTVAAWAVVTVRLYIGRDGIPAPLMYVMFLSMVFVNFLVRSIAIYTGYRSAGGEGADV